MSTPAQVPMISPDLTSTKLVPSEQVDAAKSAGWDSAYKMVGPQGESKWVPSAQVESARSSKFAVMPQPGVQRMATPEGQLTYALPSEVENFKKSGHVPIEDSGNFRVDPIEGEQNVDTMARAAKIAKNLPPDVMKKAIEAEKKTITPARVAANLTIGPIVGVATAAALTGAGEAAGAVGDAIANIPEMQYIMSSPKLYAAWLARSPLAKQALKYAVKGGAAALGFKWMSKFL